MPKGSRRRDTVDALEGIFDIYKIESKISKDAKAYDLTEDEIESLRAAYLREQQEPLEKAANRAMEWGLEILGVPPPRYSSSEEILENARQRKK